MYLDHFPIWITDHFPILANVTFRMHHKSAKVSLKRDMKNFDASTFNTELQGKIDLLFTESDHNVNDITSRFLSVFKDLIDQHAPIKTLSKREGKFKRKPWINKNLSKLIRSKNILFRKFLRSKTKNNRIAYKKARNEVTHLTQLNKKSYYSNLFRSSHSDPKSLWKNIDNVIQFKNKTSSSIQFFEDNNGHRISDPEKMTNYINDFFVNIGKSLSDAIPTNSGNTHATHFLTSKLNSIFLQPITSFEIKSLIADLNVRKGVPTHSIPIKFIKLATDVLSPFLARLFNLCIVQGCFPKALKVSEVVPVYKGGSKTKATNHRPIALLSPFSKLFEKTIYSRINHFFTSNHLFFCNQFGFQQNSSTENAVLQIFEKLLTSLDQKETTCSVFVDLRKAFDTVNHSILLSKLHKYGVRGVSYELLESYLSDRWQYSVVNSFKSQMRRITCGVPQGSTLGPLLFLIYVNDMYLATKLNLNLFADDAYFSFSSTSPQLLEDTVNEELDKILNWLNTNKLTINLSKTTYMIFCKKRRTYKFKIVIGNQEISQHKETKYLGVLIDEKLTWKNHLQKVRGKLASGCWALHRLKNYVNRQTLMMVYFGLIYQTLQYCVSCWGSASQCHLEPLNVLHRRAIRTICGVPRDAPTTPLFFELKTLKLKDIYSFQIAKIMHQIINKNYKGKYDLTLVQDIHNYPTRFAKASNYYQRPTNLKSCEKALSIVGPKVWLQVPPDIKNLPFNSFKVRYKKFLIDKYSKT